MPKVSIVIPVYNSESYLGTCIESVLQQTYTNWELILIDDGSEDQSSCICDSYAKKEPRIEVLHKRNSGVSSTRNHGLDIAKGKYIMFCDADDYWCSNTALEELVYIAETNRLDILRGEYKAVNRFGDDLFYRDVPLHCTPYVNKVMNSAEFVKYAIHGEYFLWLSLIRRDAIADLRFDEQRHFLEDVLFYSNLILKPLKAMYVPYIRFYAYRKHTQSASNRVNPRNIEEAFSMCYEFYKLVPKASNKEISSLFMENSIKMYYYTLDTISLEEYYDMRHHYITEFKLNDIRRDVVRWMKQYKLFYISPIYYTPPKFGVNLFKLRHILGTLKRNIINLIK